MLLVPYSLQEQQKRPGDEKERSLSAFEQDARRVLQANDNTEHITLNHMVA